MDYNEIERLEVCKREAEMNWERIMRNPERCKIEYEILGEAMYRLDVVEKKLMEMMYPVEEETIDKPLTFSC